MDTRSKYHSLKYVVEAKGLGRNFFWPIAAFDNSIVAQAYIDAGKGNDFQYRLMERKRGKWIEVTEVVEAAKDLEIA